MKMDNEQTESAGMKKNLEDKINLLEVQHKKNLKKLEDE